jgi:hypothetical protein
MKKILLISLLLIITTGCSEFAVLMSGGSFAASQNSYVKLYNGIDMGVVLTTKKGLKQHAYEKGKKYIIDNIDFFGNKH